MKQVQKTRAIFLAKWDLPHPCLASSAKLSNGRLKSIKRFNFWSTIKFHYIKWEKSNEKGLSILSSRLWCDFLTEDYRISVVVLMFEVPIPVLQIHGTYVIFSFFGYCWCRKKKENPKKKPQRTPKTGLTAVPPLLWYPTMPLEIYLQLRPLKIRSTKILLFVIICRVLHASD